MNDAFRGDAGREDGGDGDRLSVTPEQYDQLRRADNRARTLGGFDAQLWREEVERILGADVVASLPWPRLVYLDVVRTPRSASVPPQETPQ